MRNYLGGCRIPCFYVYALQMCDANGCHDCWGGVQRIDLGNCATCLLLNPWLLTSVSTLGHVISRTKTCEGWINVGCTSKKLTHWTATKMRWTQMFWCSAPPPFPLMISVNLPWNITEQILSLGNLSFQTLFLSDHHNFFDFIQHYLCERTDSQHTSPRWLYFVWRSNGNFPRKFVAKVGLVTLELENGIPAGAVVCKIEEYSFQ